MRFIQIFKYFLPAFRVIKFYLKYSFFYLIINLLVAPFTGIFQNFAPPVTILFILFIKKLKFRIIIGIPLLLIYFIDYLRSNFHLSFYQIISSLSFSQMLVSIYPAFLVLVASTFSMIMANKIKFRKILKNIY